MQADDGSQHVAHVLARKAPLREAAAKSLVAKDAAAAIFDGGGCAAHDDAKVMRLALQGVVVHGEDLLVVILARDGVRDLVEVHKLVDHDDQALIACAYEEAREQLDVVVPVVIGDDGRGAQIGLRLGLGAVFAAHPTGNAAFRLVIAFEGCRAVTREHAREVESMDHFLKLVKLRAHVRFGVVCLACANVERRGDPTVEDEVEGAAFGARLGREVANELAIGGKPLALTSLQASFGGKVGVRNNKALSHGVGADGLQQKALAGAVSPDEEAKARAAIGNEGKVG